MEHGPSVPQFPQPSSLTTQLAKMRRPWTWAAGTVLLGALLFVTGYFLFRSAAQDSNAQGLEDKSAVFPIFVGWDKPRPPDLAIVISGQTHGYLQPCGCSYPQKGGLARRYNFMQTLKDKGWPVTAVDLGDIAQS